jgi:hypothetical protein
VILTAKKPEVTKPLRDEFKGKSKKSANKENAQELDYARLHKRLENTSLKELIKAYKHVYPSAEALFAKMIEIDPDPAIREMIDNYCLERGKHLGHFAQVAAYHSSWRLRHWKNDVKFSNSQRIETSFSRNRCVWRYRR